MAARLHTEKWWFANPVGVIYFSLGCQPEVKKRETRFGVIFDGEAENHDKTKNAAYQIHPAE